MFNFNFSNIISFEILRELLATRRKSHMIDSFPFQIQHLITDPSDVFSRHKYYEQPWLTYKEPFSESI
jgi:hypothetical protein